MADDRLLQATKAVPKFTLAGLDRRAKCVSVYDGDTAQFVFLLGDDLTRFSCRMLGYNTAEIKTKDANEKLKAAAARDALAGLILDKIVLLKLGEFDKYGRPLVSVFADTPGGVVHVNAWMVENNFGKPYTGSGDKEW